MAIDFSALLYAPQQTILGVSVTITTEDGTEVEVTALDKSVPFQSPDPNVPTISPAAVVRAVDLADADVTAADIVGGELVMNSKTWTIKATQPRPSPNGEADGEVWLFIEEVVE